MGITLAEKSFKRRTKDAMTPFGVIHYWPDVLIDEVGDDPLPEEVGVLVSIWSSSVDINAYQKAFEQYGAYLELVGHDEPYGEVTIWEYKWRRRPGKELIFVGHNEPTVIEEQMYILSGGSEAFCQTMFNRSSKDVASFR